MQHSPFRLRDLCITRCAYGHSGTRYGVRPVLHDVYMAWSEKRGFMLGTSNYVYLRSIKFSLGPLTTLTVRLGLLGFRARLLRIRTFKMSGFGKV